MTKVKFKSSIVFIGGLNYSANEIADIDDKLAKELVKAEVVALVEEEKETAPAKKTTRKKVETKVEAD